MENNNVYDYILSESTAYKTTPITVVEGYEWNMYEHTKKTVIYKNSQLLSGKDTSDNDNKPVKNIIRPILNVAYRSEGFDVKNIEPFVNDSDNFYKSMLVRKFHNKYARKYGLDTVIDDSVETYVDYGGCLLKKVNGKAPEVVPFQRIAFVDQTDILSGPICELHMYSISQLKDMSGTWNADKIDEAIAMSLAQKTIANVSGNKNSTPGKYLEVYELHGIFPDSWLEDGGNPDTYSPQVHFITYYKSQDDKKHGITLYKGKDKSERYKLILRDKIYNRALGFGGVEELFESQVWTNYSMIQMKKMLDAAALMILQTADSTLATKNVLTDIEQGEIIVHEDGKPLTQAIFQPINIQSFQNSVTQWENHARVTGAANDAQLGENPTSGTPFKLQELVVSQGQGLHQYRKGKLAQFWGEVYRDWIIPQLVDEMNQGHKWLDELSMDELQWVANQVAESVTDERVKEVILEGKIVTPQEKETFKQLTIDMFKKGGSKKFIEIMEDEFKKIPIDVEVNIAGKQKDLALVSEKLTNIFRQVIANPQVLQNPALAKIFNEILEASGLSPADFSELTKQMPAQEVQNQPVNNQPIIQ